ncbi:phage tail assembly chaperone [Kaistia adipata]|uniref:phage tail assembly chaperone n=1 Tax=Kaistia adipata TaxID=166954 RepID=UPI000569A49C|nr:hypothetical protein [Kaistia adipata]
MVRQNFVDENGETRRQRLERFGLPVAEIELLPDEVRYLPEWFWDLNSCRASGLNGPQPLSMTELSNWIVLTGTLVRREEIAVIREMDAAYLAAVAREQEEMADRTRPRKGS